MTVLPWIAESAKHVGVAEIVGAKDNPVIVGWVKELGGWWDDDETPWCGVYVAFCLKRAGVYFPKNWFRALAYAEPARKLDRPAFGSVAVKTRKGGGHVCFVVGRDKKTGKLICRGGNQNNRVSDALYSESDFEGFYWYGKQARPNPSRFGLPVYDVGKPLANVSES